MGSPSRCDCGHSRSLSIILAVLLIGVLGGGCGQPIPRSLVEMGCVEPEYAQDTRRFQRREPDPDHPDAVHCEGERNRPFSSSGLWLVSLMPMDEVPIRFRERPKLRWPPTDGDVLITATDLDRGASVGGGTVLPGQDGGYGWEGRRRNVSRPNQHHAYGFLVEREGVGQPRQILPVRIEGMAPLRCCRALFWTSGLVREIEVTADGRRLLARRSGEKRFIVDVDLEGDGVVEFAVDLELEEGGRIRPFRDVFILHRWPQQ